MKSLWIYMLVILVSVKYVGSQCVGSGTCDCHCDYNCFLITCTSCAKEWSGTTSNRCQRQNIAYRSSVNSTSIFEFDGYQYVPENAVDGDDTSYLRTKSEPYSQLTLTLSGFFNIKYIYVYMYTEANKYYEVFVTNSDLPALTLDTECASLYQYTNQYTKDVLTCKRVLNGNQVVIRTENNLLQLFEINVYQCSQGTYGMQCERECRNCEDNRCDGYTGACESGCNIGWQGATCETKCNKNCEDNKCDQNNGFCTVGCKLDWYGDKCDRQCPSQCKTSCDRFLGCTNCTIGFNGPYCNPCDGNTYGKNCGLTCQNCDDCNNVNGCRECSNGFYGYLCDLECPNQCRNDICYRQSGVCKDGCKDGHTGTKCETPCKENCATCETDNLCISCVSGRFGTNCEYRCPQTCDGSKTCDKNSGVCSECNPGTFGSSCTQQCSNNCLPGIPSVCDRNGTCISGCVDGWFGPYCDTQCLVENCEQCNLLSSGDFSCKICNIGYYLENAQGIQKCVKCPSRCFSCDSDFRCTQCIPKFTGNQCENECNINCVDGLCELDGTCTYGCNNSKHGVGCTESCRENCVHCFTGNNCTKCLFGNYGIYCSGKCYDNCFNCTSKFECEICKPGFYGDWCNYNCDPRCLTCDSGDSCTSCRDGWSGRYCQCSKNCKNEDCDDHGICQRGCNGSYYGGRCVLPCRSNDCQRCDQTSGNCTECSKGRYGINCTEKCSGSCLERSCNMTGACLKGCNDGLHGPLCTKTHSSTLTDREKEVNIRKLQIENLRLDNKKLQKEIQKLEVETEVLQVKKNYYKSKLLTVKEEHPKVAAKMEKDNES